MWKSRSPRAERAPITAAGLLVTAAAMLAGCSSASVTDHIPTAVGGLPEGVPPRPTTPQAYPAVHDMPPARSQATLSEEERKKLRDDLAAARERAARQGATPDEATGSASGNARGSGSSRAP